MLDSKFEIVSVCEPYNYGQIFLRYTAFSATYNESRKTTYMIYPHTVKPRNLLIFRPSKIVPQIASVVVCSKWDQMVYNRVLHRRLRGPQIVGV